MTRSRRHDIVKTSKYKTSLCTFFRDEGECSFGERCAFAHGEEELRSEEENLRSRDSKEDPDTRVEDAQRGTDLGSACCVPSTGTEGGVEVVPSEWTSTDEEKMLSTVSRDSGLQSPKRKSATLRSPRQSYLNWLKEFKGYEYKGIKPPPKMTKDRSVRHNRASPSWIPNKARHGGLEGHIPNGAVHHSSSGGNVLFRVVNMSGAPGHFLQVTPSTVWVPVAGVPAPYIVPSNPGMGVHHEAAFGDCGAWSTGAHAANSFVALNPTEIGTMGGVSDVTFSAFGTFGNIPVGDDFGGNQSSTRCANGTTTSLESLPSPTVADCFSVETAPGPQSSMWSGSQGAEPSDAPVSCRGTVTSVYSADNHGRPRLVESPPSVAGETLDFKTLVDLQHLSESFRIKGMYDEANCNKGTPVNRRTSSDSLEPFRVASADAHPLATAMQTVVGTRSESNYYEGGGEGYHPSAPVYCGVNVLAGTEPCQDRIEAKWLSSTSDDVEGMFKTEHGESCSAVPTKGTSERCENRPRVMCGDERLRRTLHFQPTRPVVVNHFRSSCAASAERALPYSV